MIDNYAEFALEPGASETQKQEAIDRQKKINDIKKAYDDAYDRALTGRVQSLGRPQAPPLKPATTDLPALPSPASSAEPPSSGGTRKQKKRSPRRRTLRKK
jgi:hypothetical protein